jgi:hypothetical protein
MLRLHVLYRLRRSTLSTQCSTRSTLDTRDRFLMLNTQCPTLDTQTLDARLLILDLDTRCSTLNTRVGLLVKEIGILPRRSVAAEIGPADARGGPNDCDTDAGTDVWSCEEYQGRYGRCAWLALLVLRAVLIVAFPSRGKCINGWCPSNSRYVLLVVECLVTINSSASEHPAAFGRHKQIETCVQVLRR